jgi:hypothetical protein
MWHDDEKIRAELKMEAHTKDHVDTILAMVRAHRGLVRSYLDGSLDARAEQRAREALGPREEEFDRDAAVDAASFNREQQRG